MYSTLLFLQMARDKLVSLTISDQIMNQKPYLIPPEILHNVTTSLCCIQDPSDLCAHHELVAMLTEGVNNPSPNLNRHALQEV